MIAKLWRVIVPCAFRALRGPFAPSLRSAPSLTLRLAVHRMVPFKKNGIVMAYLEGGEKLGEFAAYQKMVVTDAGRAAGYTDLQHGEFVHVPSACQRARERVQLPVRQGMIYRVLLGEENTGSKKKADTQQRLLCLFSSAGLRASQHSAQMGGRRRQTVETNQRHILFSA